jgi:hypothetical protein
MAMRAGCSAAGVGRVFAFSATVEFTAEMPPLERKIAKPVQDAKADWQ